MTDELIGKRIGGYEILRQLGEGGMATVYLAEQESMNRQVALKMLPRHHLQDDTYLQRFKREVKIISQLDHRNIVPVYDYGEYEGQPYIVMRYMPAGSVDDLLQQGFLSPEAILDIVQQIAPALDYAHSKDVLHRDLKPSNVLMDDSGGAFLTDFGIARVVGENKSAITTQGVVGTPSYMSPEQAQGKLLDARSDVYSLGVMIYEMATGKRPFEADTAYGIAVMHVTTPPPLPRNINPTLSAAVESVILKALKKQPDERYGTAVILQEALKLAIEYPDSVHETERNLKRPGLQRSDPAAIQPQPQPMPPSQPNMVSPPSQVPVYKPPTSTNRPSSSISHAAASPGFRSRLRKRRAQHPLRSALLGGSIGCGILVVLVVLGVAALSVFVPSLFSTPTLTPDVQSVVIESTDEATPDATSEAATPERDPGSALTPSLDPTSLAARETLLARNTSASSTSRPDTAPTLIPVTRGIDPVGVRGTPDLPSAFQALSGKIVFADIRGENRTLEIITLNLDNWIETQLTQEANAHSSYPLASPDGEWIAFQSDRDGDFDIYLMTVGGGNRQQLTFNDYTDRLAAWSPDGEWIIYSSDIDGDQRYDLRRVRRDGTLDELVLSLDQRLSHARYSPDGQSIIFTLGSEPRDGRTWEIARYDLQAESLTLLTNNEVRDASAVFSPDGETILYITYYQGSNAIAAMDADGSNPRILYDSSGSDWAASYSPEGRYIIFTSNVSGSDQLYIMTADGANVQQITSAGGLYASWIPSP